MFALTMLVGSIFVFVHQNKKKYPLTEDTILGLFMVFMFAMLWFITVPAIIIIGSAWMLAKLFKLNWKSKDESKADN
jgi:TRAP-type C4-dicarboxylate transport system permease large subunit